MNINSRNYKMLIYDGSIKSLRDINNKKNGEAKTEQVHLTLFFSVIWIMFWDLSYEMITLQTNKQIRWH